MIQLTTGDNNEFSILIALCISGVINLLETQIITVDNALHCLFNPYMLNKVNEARCDDSLIRALDLCLELDCIQRQYPNSYRCAIIEIKSIVNAYLKNADIPREIFIK